MGKKKSIIFFGLSGLSFVFFVIVILGGVIGILKLSKPTIQSIQHSLEWLPQEYPRLEERFEVDKAVSDEIPIIQIEYRISQENPTVSWKYSLELSDALFPSANLYGIDFWEILDNSMILHFRRDFFQLLIGYIVVICFFGAIFFWLAWAFYGYGKDLRQKAATRAI